MLLPPKTGNMPPGFALALVMDGQKVTILVVPENHQKAKDESVARPYDFHTCHSRRAERKSEANTANLHSLHPNLQNSE